MLATTPTAASRKARRSLPATVGWTPGPETTDAARLWILGDRTFAVREPTVARRSSGAPLFSMTLTLERQPTVEETSLAPLVRGASCALTLDVTPTDAELETAFRENRPAALFLRGAVFALVRASDGHRITEAAAIGFGGRAGLQTTFDAEQASAVLRALRGEDSGIDVVAELSYRPPPAPPPFTFALAEVFAFLDERADDERTFLEVELVYYFARLIQDAIIVVRAPSADRDADAKALIAACAAILTPDGDRFRLARELPANQHDDGMQVLVLKRPLHALLQPLTSHYPMEALVSAVSPSRDGGFQPVGARVSGSRGPVEPALASLGGESVAMTVALRTGRATKANAAALAHSSLASRLPTPGHWAVQDAVLELPSSPLPQIDDPSALLWRDRVDATRFWYAPELSFLMPAPRDVAGASSFLFSFRTIGHDADGRPGLEATIQLRLRAAMSAETHAAWEALGKPAATPVPLGGLSVSLEIPFRTSTGQTQAQAIKASSVVANGADYDVAFTLTDQWARLAYGSLSSPDFQIIPTRIATSFTFRAFVRSARLGEPHRIQAIVPSRAPLVSAHGPHTNPTLPRPPIRPPITPLPIRPYVVQTQGRSAVIDASVPCNTFGALYVQATDGGLEAVGCRDAFKLGVVELKLFERVALDFGVAAPFQVLRSLQVPGRFLVLPTSYTVARFEPGDGRAYRPALFLLANVDGEHLERSRCVVAATLEPAVSAYWRDALIAKLADELHPTPELTWPGDLDVSPAFEWALTGSVEADSVRTPEGFQVSLSTGVDGVLLLKSMIERNGVAGSVTFPLADGTKLRSSLVVDLAHISGPFVAGPVEVELSGTTAKLTNRLEQPVNVGSLAVLAGGRRTVVAVEKQLASGASTTMAVPAGARGATVDAIPLGEVASFEEIRTYVEDIYVSVIFIANLDFAAVDSLAIETTLVGVAGSVQAVLTSSAPRAEVTLLLPLTSYLAQPTIRYAITRTPRTGMPVTGPWRDWRLDTLGSVVEIKATDLP